MKYFFIVGLVLFHAVSSLAQNSHKRFHIGPDVWMNFLPELELLSGEAFLDRTETKIAYGLSSSFSFRKEKYRFDPYFGFSVGIMNFKRSYVQEITNTFFFGLNYVDQDLGRQYSATPRLGFRYWMRSRRGGISNVAWDAALLLSRNWYYGERKDEFITHNTLGFNLGITAQSNWLHVSPFVQYLLGAPIERKYTWEVPYDTEVVTGSAISRHGNFLVGVQLGVCF